MGINQTIPLLNATGYDAWQLMLEQRIVTRARGRVFPHHSKSVGTAFRRSCKALTLMTYDFMTCATRCVYRKLYSSC